MTTLWEEVAEGLLPQPPDPYAKDPVGWAKNKLGVFLWSKQREIAEAVVVHRRVAVKASHDVGKSHLAGVLACWWLSTRPVGDAFVASTAPSYPQVHAILWEEIRKQHKRGALAGEVGQSDEWKIGGTLVGYGRKPADRDEHGFQGIHRRYVLGILDESCGVPAQLFTAMEAITTNDNCRILAIGNPDDPSTEFANVCKPGSGWHVIRIDGRESPNFTDEKIPESIRPLLLSPDWVEDKKKRWGESSPLFVSKVTGDFPEISDDTLIPPSWITAAQERTLEPEGTTRLSVDVARFGADRTVLGLAVGPVFRVVADHGKEDTMTTVGRVVHGIRTHNVDDVRVEGVGVGAGVVDRLVELGVDVDDMQPGAQASDPEKFANARAEWWWGIRERFEQGAEDIDPDDMDLAAQLGSIKYKFTSRGQILIESKDDMKKRGLPSPDRADTLMLAQAFIRDDLGDTVTHEDLEPDLAAYSISQY